MKKAKLLIALTCIFYTIAISAQKPKQLTSGEIYKSLERFNFLGNALFVAAHPDDENTRMISHLVNEVNAHTTYLSLTRGDGGQNLIGSEISELLGVIRTQELLAARRTDGGHQMFTRANDFGFSKNAEETISIWDDELVKRDVVWAIRKLKPDVIINRFDHLSSGKTHGHHTASAMLSFELFEKAADPSAYTDQLQYVAPWTAERLFFNTSWWFYGSQEAFDKADKSKMLSLDCGTYYPLLAKSNNEIAAESRSNHKCQGFGSTGSRGAQSEYLQLLKGTMPSDRSQIFDGINTTWTRVSGGAFIKENMDSIMDNFDFKNPAKSVPNLMRIYKHLDTLKDEFWKNRKKEELKNIIASCLGLYVEAITSDNSAVPGEKIDLDIEVTQRLPGKTSLKKIVLLPGGIDTILDAELEVNAPIFQKFSFNIPQDAQYTSAYWLTEEGSLGMYKVDNPQWVGLPETPKPYIAEIHLEIEGQPITFYRNFSYKYNDAEDGEIYQPFEITPELFVSTASKVYVFADNRPSTISVTIQSGAKNQQGLVTIPLPSGWQCSPLSHSFDLGEKGQSTTLNFEITPPSFQSDIIINPIVQANGKEYTKSLVKIDYNHIPLQRILRPVNTRLVNIDLQKAGQRIAYIMGAGDDIPSNLRQIGYTVDELNIADITEAKLKNYDALVLGVRAYNTLDDLKFKQDIMHKYVEDGGTMVVQYNTSRGVKVNEVGPYPISLSRDRVTVEEAPIRILAENHPVLKYPNVITDADFDGWVQERGLYFPDKWDDKYTPILSCNDPGEDAKDGGLLIANHGKGYFVYTGYSWFRQLPAGVPGAYRIFANLVSLGKDIRP